MAVTPVEAHRHRPLGHRRQEPELVSREDCAAPLRRELKRQGFILRDDFERRGAAGAARKYEVWTSPDGTKTRLLLVDAIGGKSLRAQLFASVVDVKAGG
jgi:hypothetical protein